MSKCSCVRPVFRLSLHKGEGRMRIQSSSKEQFHPSPQSSPLKGGEADSLEPDGRLLARLNVLIHAEEIIGVVFLFDRDQPVIIAAVRFLHAFLAFIAHEEFYVCSAR